MSTDNYQNLYSSCYILTTERWRFVGLLCPRRSCMLRINFREIYVCTSTCI